MAQNGQRSLLSITVEQQVLWTIVRVSGELDFATQAQLGDCLFELIAEAEQPRICVDVRELGFCDSRGVACLIVAWKVAAHKGGSVVLLRPRADLARQLAVIGLTQALPVIDEFP